MTTHNKWIFILGRIVSVLGTQIYNFVFALVILYTTGSAINFAITIVLETVPRILFSTISGIVADRYNRKKILVCTDILSGTVLFLAFFVMSVISNYLWIVFIVTFLLNTINTFFDVTMNASLESLFKDEKLDKMCSINEGISSLIALLAPTIGAVIYSVTDFKIFMLINGISFLISAFTEMYLEYPNGGNVYGRKKSVKEEFHETALFLRKKRVVFDLYFVAIFINIFYGIAANLSFPIILTKYSGVSEVEYGMIETVLSLGALLGAAIFSLVKASKRYRLIIVSLMFEAFSIILIAVPNILNIKVNIFGIYSVIALVLGISVSSVNINVRVLMQKMIPDNIKGKVLGTLSSMCLSIGPIVVILGSFYAEKNNPCYLVLFSGVGFLIMNVLLSLDRELKKV